MGRPRIEAKDVTFRRYLNRSLTVGVDPPGAWCVWCNDGVLVSGADENEVYGTEAMGRILKEMEVDRRRFCMAAVERPWGISEPGREQSILRNAISCGWWRHYLYRAAMVNWAPTAGQWRRWLGIRGTRAQCKEQAMHLATKLTELQVEARIGPPKDHNEAEARLIAMAAWLRYGLVTHGDLTHRWMIAFNVPYRKPPPIDTLTRDDRGRVLRELPMTSAGRRRYNKPLIVEEAVHDPEAEGEEGPW